MLNTNFKISERSHNTAFAEWTSPGADYVSWLLVNGFIVLGPILSESIERQARFRFTKTLNKCIEIHEFPVNDVEPNNICIKENDRPIIIWNRNATALQYRIYHTPFGGSETLIKTVKVISDRAFYSIESPVRLVEGWHFFRVEAVNAYGIASTTALWRFRTYRIPTPVNGLTVADGSGSGLFDITIN